MGQSGDICVAFVCSPESITGKGSSKNKVDRGLVLWMVFTLFIQPLKACSKDPSRLSLTGKNGGYQWAQHHEISLSKAYLSTN